MKSAEPALRAFHGAGGTPQCIKGEYTGQAGKTQKFLKAFISNPNSLHCVYSMCSACPVESLPFNRGGQSLCPEGASLLVPTLCPARAGQHYKRSKKTDFLQVQLARLARQDYNVLNKQGQNQNSGSVSNLAANRT